MKRIYICKTLNSKYYAIKEVENIAKKESKDVNFTTFDKLISRSRLIQSNSIDIVIDLETITQEQTKIFNYRNNLVILLTKEPKIKTDIEIIVEKEPELKDIKESINYKCNKLSKEAVNYLAEAYEDNLFILENELKKLSLFNNQEEVFELAFKENNYIEQQEESYKIVNYLFDKELVRLIRYIKQNNIDLKGSLVVAILISTIEKYIKIKLGNLSAKDLKVSDKQYNYLKFYTKQKLSYTTEQLIDLYNNLVDKQLKIRKGYYRNDNEVFDAILFTLIK